MHERILPKREIFGSILKWIFIIFFSNMRMQVFNEKLKLIFHVFGRKKFKGRAKKERKKKNNIKGN